MTLIQSQSQPPLTQVTAPSPRPSRYSALHLLKVGLAGRNAATRAWRDPVPKAAYDVVVVGGGGHGLATAYYLARARPGTSIAVLERGWIGGGNVGRNTTIVRSNYRLPESQRFLEASLKLWEGLSDDLNYNVMFSQRGVIWLGHSDADMTRLAERGDALRCEGIDAELVSCDALARLEPALDLSPSARFPVQGALLQRRGGTARHDAVAWGYARAADSLGVDILQNCEVVGLNVKGGRIQAVETVRGVIAAGRVGLCATGGSSRLAAMAGLRLPLETHNLQAFVSEPIKPMLKTVLLSQSLHCYLSQSDKGEIVLGGDPDRYPTFAQRNHDARLSEVASQALSLVPALSRLRMLRCWAGATDMSFDGSPIIDKTPVEGLFINAGWCYGGFKATPASGFAYAQLLADGRAPPLIEGFGLDRFAAGATIDEAGAGPMPHHR